MQNRRKIRRRSGFTLVELSIVLVIIGLIAGGVLVARDLIEIAKARSYMSQMNQYEVAYNTFRLKYNCMPGDCNKATQFGLGPNGNGDGILNGWSQICSGACGVVPGYSSIEGPTTPDVYHLRGYGEGQWFWLHLSASELIRDSITPMIAADRQPAINGDELALYYPKLNSSSGYLIAFSWGNRTFIKNGLTSLSTPYAKPAYTDKSTTGTHLQYISGKYGYSIITDTNYTACTNHYCDYPTVLRAGQRIAPTSPANGRVYQAATYAAAGYNTCILNNSGTLGFVSKGINRSFW